MKVMNEKQTHTHTYIHNISKCMPGLGTKVCQILEFVKVQKIVQKKTQKGNKKKAIISPKGQVPVFWSRLAPATLYRRGRTGAEPVDIPTLDRAGPVKTGPCKLYGVPTG